MKLHSFAGSFVFETSVDNAEFRAADEQVLDLDLSLNVTQDGKTVSGVISPLFLAIRALF